jgi:hypothetical protein
LYAVNFNSVSILCISEEGTPYLQVQEVMWMKIKCDEWLAAFFVFGMTRAQISGRRSPTLTAVFHGFSHPHCAVLE